MRNYEQEYNERVAYIREYVEKTGVKGIVYGNSGGKDCTLVGILCKAACENTVGVIMPCGSSCNYGSDREDALAVAEQYGIETRTVDLTAVRDAEMAALKDVTELNQAAISNIAPRLRMTTLYAIAMAENRLVAGTGNRSEIYMGYFTKWGDGGSDFDPIADLTATEIFEFMAWLNVPMAVQTKAPSAGLFEGQTDEQEMGVTYAAIDRYIQGGSVSAEEEAIIRRFHSRSEHKRVGRVDYPNKL